MLQQKWDSSREDNNWLVKTYGMITSVSSVVIVVVVVMVVLKQAVLALDNTE